MHCTAHAKTACTALYNARALHCTTLCTARALLCTHTGASYESYTYRILYAQYNRAITGPGALFERGLYCLVRANGWTSIREGLLFEGGFYSRVYGTLHTKRVVYSVVYWPSSCTCLRAGPRPLRADVQALLPFHHHHVRSVLGLSREDMWESRMTSGQLLKLWVTLLTLLTRLLCGVWSGLDMFSRCETRGCPSACCLHPLRRTDQRMARVSDGEIVFCLMHVLGMRLTHVLSPPLPREMSGALCSPPQYNLFSSPNNIILSFSQWIYWAPQMYSRETEAN